MNTIIKRFLICFILPAALILNSCDESASEPVIEYLEVNANNISGNWKLQDWNGSSLAEGTQMYIRFVRNDQTYCMWQTMDSFNDIPHIVTGEFNITTDVEFGAIINGRYDNDEGLWQHRYSITDLTATQMTWTAVDDPQFVQIFVRVDEIPFEE